MAGMTFFAALIRPILQSSASGLKPIRFVDTPAALQSCLDDLRACTVIAFDLEFDSHRHSYGVTLCLIQIATPESCYVIDPFAPIALKGIYEVFEDDRILKIMHSPGEDLRLLHSLRCYPKQLFDTEVVARLLNYEQTSLAAMLQEKLGHSMSKQQQRSNWLRRPLSQEQLLYAADDVAFLHQLKDVLVAEAEERDLIPYIAEEQEALSTTIHEPGPKDSFLKQGDFRSLSPYSQHVLNGLFLFRDELARQLNKPAYQVLDEQIVRDLASGDLKPAELSHAKGVYGSYRNAAFAARLASRLEAIRDEGDRLGLARTMPPRQRLSNGERVDREAAAKDKEEKFAPVQQALAARFGAHAARYILSNGTVNELLKRTMSIDGIKRAYKQKLVRETARDLGIDLSQYESPAD